MEASDLFVSNSSELLEIFFDEPIMLHSDQAKPRDGGEA
jgi:hypothetical protein